MASSSKVPSPAVVQSTEVWFVAAPDKRYVPVSQIEASVPASAVGESIIVNTISSVASSVQGAVAYAVSVRVTLPAAISAVPGV